MCDPVSMFAASTVAALGSAAMGGESDYAEYGKKVRAINEESEAINKSTIFKYQLNSLQQQQIADKAAAERGTLRTRLAEATGSGEAAAASAGVEGNSVTALLNGFSVATGKDLMYVGQDESNQATQAHLEAQGIKRDADNRKVSVRNQLPDDPTTKVVGRFLSAAMGVGSSYASLTTPVKMPDGSMSRRFG